MIKQKFNHALVAAVAAATALTLTPLQANAATPSLTVVEIASSNNGGVATVGGSVAPVFSTPGVSATPYAVGPYVVLWNFTNASPRKLMKKITTDVFVCNLKSQSENIAANPMTCGSPVRDVQNVLANSPTRNVTGWTFSKTIDGSNLHKKWIRTRLTLSFEDGTTTASPLSTPKMYFDNSPRNEIPTASTRSTDNASVPQNSDLTMTFNQWTNLATWNTGTARAVIRRVVVYRCASRPVDSPTEYVSTDANPAGCQLIAQNNEFEVHNGQAIVRPFTSGPKGTFIYAFDTLRYNDNPEAGNYVYMQKRAIYSTYDPAESPTGSAPVQGGGAQGEVSPLQAAGINLGAAPVVSDTGQVTANGITAVISANERYQRSRERRALKLQATPNRRARGTMVAALVSTKDGVDTVHRTVTKQIRRGKAEWKWRFPATFARGRYTLYVSITPTNPEVDPVTLSKTIRLR